MAYKTPPMPENVECRAAPRELLNVATRRKEAQRARKCRAAVSHCLACGTPFAGPLFSQTC